MNLRIDGDMMLDSKIYKRSYHQLGLCFLHIALALHCIDRYFANTPPGFRCTPLGFRSTALGFLLIGFQKESQKAV